MQKGAGAVQGLLASVREPAEGLAATVVGLMFVFVGATTVFAELQDALDRISRRPCPLCPWPETPAARHGGSCDLITLAKPEVGGIDVHGVSFFVWCFGSCPAG
jgi:hypothetical protein